MNKSIVRVSGEFNSKKITLETGRLAKLAKSSVLVSQGGTTVLVAVTAKPGSGDTDFLPLKIDYEERYYAAGNIGGNRYQRREGQPNDNAIISARLIDHAIRPLFPKDFVDETQIVVTVLSIDGENSPALLGFLGASAALSISGLPFHGPIVQVNIEIHDEHFSVNLDETNHDAKMHLHAAYTREGKLVQAIEAEGAILPEKEVFEAVKFGSESVKPLFDLLNEFTSKVNVIEDKYVSMWLNKEVKDLFREDIYSVLDKIDKNCNPFEASEWRDHFKAIISKCLDSQAKRVEIDPKVKTYSEGQISQIFYEVQKDWIRQLVLEKGKRVDSRGFDEIRELSAEIGVIPRVHGSAIFNRGMTQALTIATLGSNDDNLTMQNMDHDTEKNYFHHYNFPPYSTGETGKVGGTNRRSIGHGILAEKAIVPVLPELEKFPYTLRVVSEILTSNGSTSMASTCGSSLALMDAGVPIKEHVGGIGIGLFTKDPYKENPKLDDFIVLTDISGNEDFAGYMDYKMTGTRNGVTAIQMELKLKGIPIELLEKIIEVSKVARMKVLDVMNAVIDKPREEISEFAPKVDMIRISKDQIGYVIGSGGKMIKEISEKFGVEVSVDEKETDAIVTIASPNKDALNACKNYIVGMLKEVKIGEIYEGIVTRVEGYGAFVEILPKQEGLLHVSEFSHGFTSNMEGVLNIGDKVKVQVKGLENGKISLSKKSLEEETEEQKLERESRPSRSSEFSGGFGGGRSHDHRTDGNRGRRNDRNGDRGRGSNRGFNRDRGGDRDGGFRPYR